MFKVHVTSGPDQGKRFLISSTGAEVQIDDGQWAALPWPSAEKTEDEMFRIRVANSRILKESAPATTVVNGPSIDYVALATEIAKHIPKPPTKITGTLSA